MRARPMWWFVLPLLAVLIGTTTAQAPAQAPGKAPTQAPAHRSTAPAPGAPGAPGAPLAGLRIALDPGHQLGNHNFPRQTNRLVDAGGFKKACNTTGTSTNAGVAEATVNMQLARQVRRRLVALGAQVPMTRYRNTQRRWGPCVDARGRFGARSGAQLMVSLHADGASSSAYGFHVITPKGGSRYTDDIAAPSLGLATDLRDALGRAGIPRSTYIGGGTALSVRSDLGTLNLSDVPAVMIEIGNMRNSTDASRMTSATGQAGYADGVVAGIRAFLRR